MYNKHYDVGVIMDDGSQSTVELRLTIGAKFALKKKYNEDALTVLFDAGSDDEKLIDVLNHCLTWKGNTNVVQSGEELLERMIDNGNMGIAARQKLVINIGKASGTFSDEEADRLIRMVDEDVNARLSGAGGDGMNNEDSVKGNEEIEKNV